MNPAEYTKRCCILHPVCYRMAQLFISSFGLDNRPSLLNAALYCSFILADSMRCAVAFSILVEATFNASNHIKLMAKPSAKPTNETVAVVNTSDILPEVVKELTPEEIKAAADKAAADTLAAALELVQKHFKLASLGDLTRAASWGKKVSDARSKIGGLKARCIQTGESSHSLRNKRTEMIEGVAWNISSLPESDVKLLAKLVNITKAGARLDAATV